MNLEDQLREALRREPAPPDFKKRLLERIPSRRVSIPLWRRPSALAVAAALTLGILIPEGASEYRRREKQRGIEARNELIAALVITKTKLHETKRMIRRATRHSS